ncbi:MAG: helix-turn-helix domain-containing protein [Chitinophagales bacterium]
MEESIYYIGLAQSIFVAFVFLTKRHKLAADWILTSWLLAIGFRMLVLIMEIEHGEFFDAQFSVSIVPLTFGPFLFLYTKSLIFNYRSLNWKEYLHFIPFIALTLLYFLFFQDKLYFESGYLIFKKDGYSIARIIYGLIFIASVFYYSSATLYMINKYRKLKYDSFSYFSSNNMLNWLYFLSAFFMAMYVFFTSMALYNMISQTKLFEIEYFSDLSLVMLTFSVSYFGIKQNYLFHQPIETTEVKEAVAEVKEKYKNSNLTEDLKSEYIQKILDFMDAERPHLNPELTIQDLSNQMNITRHHLTEILNNDLGKNFFNFINEYRVAEVKKRLLDSKYAHLTIVAIAFDSGFNSKSTFNSIFKQQTESTPSKWRDSELKKLANL